MSSLCIILFRYLTTDEDTGPISRLTTIERLFLQGLIRILFFFGGEIKLLLPWKLDVPKLCI